MDLKGNCSKCYVCLCVVQPFSSLGFSGRRHRAGDGYWEPRRASVFWLLLIEINLKFALFCWTRTSLRICTYCPLASLWTFSADGWGRCHFRTDTNVYHTQWSPVSVVMTEGSLGEKTVRVNRRCSNRASSSWLDGMHAMCHRLMGMTVFWGNRRIDVLSRRVFRVLKKFIEHASNLSRN